MTKEKTKEKDKNKEKPKDINLFREMGRVIAGSYYDHQLVRIQEVNRVRDIIVRKAEGLGLTEIQEKKEKKSYEKKYTDKEIQDLFQKMKDKNVFTEDERFLIDKITEVQKQAEKFEKLYSDLMMEFVSKEPIYNEFLEKIKGISAVLSANLLKEFGYCEKAPYISSVWKYCGMHVVDGKSPKRSKGKQLEFSIKRRTMVWKIADSLMKQRTPFYREIYDTEKEIQHNREYKEGELKEKYGKPYKKEDTHISKGHAHSRALRKMVKIFLAHYWQACKELSQGFKENHEELAKPYVETKLGHKHISNWKEAVASNEMAKLKGKKVQKDKVKYE